MTAKQLLTEQKRFNALSPKRAKAILKRMDGQAQAMRSCWYCNGAHEHLKRADYPFVCLWGCGMTYIAGFPARAVVMRAEAQKLTAADMREFNEALEES